MAPGRLESVANSCLDGIELPDVSPPSLSLETDKKDLFAETKYKAWGYKGEARCDFSYKLKITNRSDVTFISIWYKTLYGRTLSDIKSDPLMIDKFAQSLAPVIQQTLGNYLNNGQWAICTTPKRRHLIKNFASMVAEKIAEMLQIPFYEDVAFCKTKHRLNAVFELNVLPKESNIIVFDDFVTTGSTLKSMKNLLTKYGKNLVFFAGINNKM